MSQPLPLQSHLTAIWASISHAPEVSLFLDFDGTLTPITESPAEARLSPPVRRTLKALSARDDLLVVLISGRALSDLRERTGISGIVYAGNHGLEISGRGVEFVEPSAEIKSRFLLPICESLEESLRAVPGASVERKRLTASVHYRRAAPERAPEIEKMVRAAVAPAASLFRIDAGKMVWEIVPRTNWHKGAAICWINSRLAGTEPVSVIMGDDTTDETGFQLSPEDITIHVGEPRGTSAKYYVGDTGGVHEFLTGLLTTREGVRARSGAGT
jgi:trehalose 6-phosphate phosphatase